VVKLSLRFDDSVQKLDLLEKHAHFPFYCECDWRSAQRVRLCDEGCEL